METPKQDTSTDEFRSRLPLLAGAAMATAGGLILLDNYLKTGWLLLSIPAIVGALLLAISSWLHKPLLTILGSLTTGLGVGLFLLLSPSFGFGTLSRVGFLLLSFGAGWFSITVFTGLLFDRSAWWALAPGSLITASGGVFLFTPLRLVDFVLYLCTALGLALLMWGMARRLFGLIIPGCLLAGIGPGIYLAWGNVYEANALVQTGIMLVSFAFGWILITLFTRVLTHKFVWWPLIPGGVLAMVGWGLYLGGDPNNALQFIGNTGSIALIIFGLYLLLLRRGLQQ